jgi:hypothetical protein
MRCSEVVSGCWLWSLCVALRQGRFVAATPPWALLRDGDGLGERFLLPGERGVSAWERVWRAVWEMKLAGVVGNIVARP